MIPRYSFLDLSFVLFLTYFFFIFSHSLFRIIKNELEAAKANLQLLLSEKKQLLDEKTQIGISRDHTRDKINLKINEEKVMKSELKFNNLESIDSQIRELEARQARTTMSLQEEKKIIKDIHALEMSKKIVSVLLEIRSSIEELKLQKIEFDQLYNNKLKQIQGCFDQINSQRLRIEKINQEKLENREVIPNLKIRQNEIKKEIDQKYQDIKTLRNEFKLKEDAYYLALSEERQRKKEQKQKEIESKKLEEELRRKTE